MPPQDGTKRAAPKVVINAVQAASSSSSSDSPSTCSRLLSNTVGAPSSPSILPSDKYSSLSMTGLSQPLLSSSHNPKSVRAKSIVSSLFARVAKSNKNVPLLTRRLREANNDFGVKTIGQFGSFVYLVNQIFGTGVIAIPNVVASSGWLPAIVADGFVCCAASIGTLMMLRCMTLVKGNRNFERRLEYMAVMEQFLCKSLYNFIQVCFYLSILSSNLASIIVVAQAVDHILVKTITWDLMLQIYPYPWLMLVDEKTLSTIYGDKQLTLGITIGYILTACGCIPLALQTMEENMKIQYISFAFLITTLGGLSISAASKVLGASQAEVEGTTGVSTEAVEQKSNSVERIISKSPDQSAAISPYIPSSPRSEDVRLYPIMEREMQLTGPEPLPTSLITYNPFLGKAVTDAEITSPSSPSNDMLANGSLALLFILLGRRLLRRQADRTISPALSTSPVGFSKRALRAVSSAGSLVKPPSLFGQSNYGELMSTFLASYSFVNTIPSWANEMTWTVDVVAAVKYASYFTFTVYYVFGYIMAYAYPNAHSDNILQYVLSDQHRGLWQLFLVYAFDLITVAPGILVYCITMRYNLINSENMSRSRAVFWGAVFPFTVAWLVSNNSRFSTLLTWSSLVFSLMVNFIAPCLIFLVACCVSKPSQRNPVNVADRNSIQNFLMNVGFQISFWCASERALEQFVSYDDPEYQLIQLHFRPGQASQSDEFSKYSIVHAPEADVTGSVSQMDVVAANTMPDNPFAPSPTSLRSPINQKMSRSRFAITPTQSQPRGHLGDDSVRTMSICSRVRLVTCVPKTYDYKLIQNDSSSPAVTLLASIERDERPFPGVKRRLPIAEALPGFPSKIARLHEWDTAHNRRLLILAEKKKRKDTGERGPVTAMKTTRSSNINLVTDRWKRKLRQSRMRLHNSSASQIPRDPGTHRFGVQSMSLWPYTERSIEGGDTHRSIRTVHHHPISVPASVRSSAVDEIGLRQMFDSTRKPPEDFGEQYDEYSWSECEPLTRRFDGSNQLTSEADTHISARVSAICKSPIVAPLVLPPRPDDDDTAPSSMERATPQLSRLPSECVFTTEGFREHLSRVQDEPQEPLYQPAPDGNSPRKYKGLPLARRRDLQPQAPDVQNSVRSFPSPLRQKREMSLQLPIPPLPVRWLSPMAADDKSCAPCLSLDSDLDSSEGPAPIKGAEDAYEQDEDILGEVENIRIHVFPRGVLRRNHVEFTVVLLFMLTLSCTMTASLRIFDDLTFSG
eukprot:Blabericola_migrator_1__5252@NODE_26_length_20894_cov_127_933788_g23_i0_p2_GENE_NODE_26_length_20894_cov_127_933788_g23_i0NODE_26_length_20894_cov_127_933788_g23_i0_p2_ORF_typecomplete_len1250_score123_64Aa_trans/PF01490_18/9_1e15Aa_trans/PF01490_18/1_1e07_NODE_26_length_20894_cov_127_933788_g23_i01373017479